MTTSARLARVSFLLKGRTSPTSLLHLPFFITQQLQISTYIQSINFFTPTQTKQTTPTITMDTVKNAANYVSDKASEVVNSASKETNKEVAKDSNVSVGNRAEAGKDYVKDALSEVSFTIHLLPT